MPEMKEDLRARYFVSAACTPHAAHHRHAQQDISTARHIVICAPELILMISAPRHGFGAMRAAIGGTARRHDESALFYRNDSDISGAQFDVEPISRHA